MTDAEKVRTGSRGKLRGRGVEVVGSEPVAPSVVAGSEVAREEWDRIVAALRQNGTLTAEAWAFIESAALAYEDFILARKSYDGSPFVTADSGRVYAHPGVALSSEAWRRRHAALQALGLGPVFRAKAVKAPAEVDPAKSKLGKYVK